MPSDVTTVSESEQQLPDRQSFLLWVGLLGAPAVWGVQFQAGYALVPKACANQSRLLLHLLSLLFLALAAGGVWLAYREWHRLRPTSPSGTDEERIAWPRFLALLGMMTSALFVLLIIAQGLPSFFIDPCVE